MTPGDALGLLIVASCGCSLLLATLGVLIWVVQSFRDDQPGEPGDGDIELYVAAGQPRDLVSLLSAYGVTQAAIRHEIGGEG